MKPPQFTHGSQGAECCKFLGRFAYKENSVKHTVDLWHCNYAHSFAIRVSDTAAKSHSEKNVRNNLAKFLADEDHIHMAAVEAFIRARARGRID